MIMTKKGYMSYSHECDMRDEAVVASRWSITNEKTRPTVLEDIAPRGKASREVKLCTKYRTSCSRHISFESTVLMNKIGIFDDNPINTIVRHEMLSAAAFDDEF